MSTFNELIDFTRSTTGTYLDSVVYGEELVTNGDFSNGTTGWTQSGSAQGTWAVTSGVLQCTGSTGFSNYLSTPFTCVVGKTYAFSVDVIAIGNADTYIGIGVTPSGRTMGNAYVHEDVVGTYSATFTATQTTHYVVIQTKAGTSDSVDNTSVKEVIGGQVSGTPLLRTAAINEPRLEYDASGNPLGLLIEEARTNLVNQSENLTTWLKASGGAVVANQTIAPDGTQTADEIVGVVYKAANIGSDTRSFSVYLKANAGTMAQVRIDVPASNRITVDLTDGSVISSTGSSLDSYGVKDVGNGWYLCHIVVTGSINNYVIVSEANNASHTVYAWGAQLEQGAFPTSYIPTSGSTVTRNSDLAPIPVERFAFNASEGTLFVHAVTAAGINATTGQCAVSMSSGSVTDCYRLRKNVSTGQIGMLKRVSDSNVMNINGKIVGETSTFKACGNYSSTNLNISIDGEDVITGSASSSTITISKVDVGTSPFGDADCFNGHIKQIQYYPKRLSNTELQLLTQPSASPTMNLTFDGQATSTLVEGLHD